MRKQKSPGVYRLFCGISTCLLISCGPDPEHAVSSPSTPAQTSGPAAPRWTPSFGEAPIGYVESVPPTIAAGSDIRFSGWAVDGVDGAPVKAVTVMIDGYKIANASLGFPRPDVAETLGKPGMRRAGWIAVASTRTLQPGRHTYSVVAENSRGHSATLQPVGDGSFTIEAP